MTLALALLLLAGQTPAGASEPIPVLLVGGANNHWWEWTHASLEEILRESDKFAVSLTTEPAKTLAAGELERYRAIVLDYNGPRWGEAAEAAFVDAVRGGVGVVVVHAANNAFEGWKDYERMIGLCWREGAGHGRFHAFDVDILDREHPVTRDMDNLRAHPDELYHGLTRAEGAEFRVLASAHSSLENGGTGRDEPMVLVGEFGAGRVFHTPLGHVWRDSESDQRSHRDPQFRELIVRGTEWAATGRVSPSRRPPNTLTAAEREAGWRLLFDGQSTAGWRAYRGEAFPEQGWAVEDGALRKLAGTGGGDIASSESWADFELRFEWKVAPGANSGVMFRVDEQHDYPWQTGAEYQILDDQRHADGKDPRTSAASLYGLVACEGKRLAEVGDWNRARILAIGNHVEHWLNGVRVVSYEIGSPAWSALVAASKFSSMPDFGTRARGGIVLQDHGDDVWFRNIAIRDLDFDPQRSVALFDGRGLEGWTHHLNAEAPASQVWSVTPDGVLVCAGQPIGYLRTERDWTNYALRLEWRFDPEKGAGNSGVLMRLIGEDKVWPRSIEAQLQSGAAGDFWNIDGFPMEVALARTQGRNTRRTADNEKPLGEWNRYDITVWHDRVVLRVNDRILNEAWGCLEIPGKIGLQSEGAEIHFREIGLTPLP